MKCAPHYGVGIIFYRFGRTRLDQYWPGQTIATKMLIFLNISLVCLKVLKFSEVRVSVFS